MGGDLEGEGLRRKWFDGSFGLGQTLQHCGAIELTGCRVHASGGGPRRLLRTSGAGTGIGGG